MRSTNTLKEESQELRPGEVEMGWRGQGAWGSGTQKGYFFPSGRALGEETQVANAFNCLWAKISDVCLFCLDFHSDTNKMPLK